MYIYPLCISNVLVLVVCAKEIYCQLFGKVQLDWNKTMLPVSTKPSCSMEYTVTTFALLSDQDWMR